MTAEREGLAEEIARVLGEHRLVRDDFSPHCLCGRFRNKRDHDQVKYRAHLADALADLLAARDRRVRAEAWAEGSLAMRKARMVQGESLPQNPYRADRIEAP